MRELKHLGHEERPRELGLRPGEEKACVYVILPKFINSFCSRQGRAAKTQLGFSQLCPVTGQEATGTK